VLLLLLLLLFRVLVLRLALWMNGWMQVESAPVWYVLVDVHDLIEVRAEEAEEEMTGRPMDQRGRWINRWSSEGERLWVEMEN